MKTAFDTELRCFIFIYKYFNSIDKTKLWFLTKNPLLGNKTPYWFIATGKSKKLLGWIETNLEGYRP